MPSYTFSLTDDEKKAFETEVQSVEEFVSEYVQFRAKKSLTEIVNKTTNYCITENIPIPSTQSEILTMAFESGLAKPLVQVILEQQQALRTTE